jgi:hypothetical protein
MKAIANEDRRRQPRVQGVLPVRVRGKDVSGEAFEALAHTLDIAAGGVRLGAIRHEMNVGDKVTVFRQQRRMDYIVMWSRVVDGKGERQVGLKALSEEREAWGADVLESQAAKV